MVFAVLFANESVASAVASELSAPVSKFTYVLTLASIITALGLRSILSGVAWIVTCRKQVRVYSLHVLGALMVFLLQIQFWFGSFTKRLLEEWRFEQLIVFLLTPILYFVLAELLFPSRVGADVDFKVLYWGNFRWFYGLAVIILMNNILVDRLMPPELPLRANVIRLVASGILIVMAIVKSAKVHACAYAALITLFALFVWMFSYTV